MDEGKNVKKSMAFRRLIVILRYIFLGLICWSFFYSIFSIIREGTVGLIIGLASIIIFVWMSGDVMSPGKLNNKEFGKSTNISIFLIELTTILCLVILFGIGF
jgi:hypothetical protein